MSTITCPCTRPGTVVDPVSGLAECGSGTTGPDLLCLPPGPGIGHQIIRDLHRILAGLGRVRLIDYPGHGRSTPVASAEALTGRISTAVRPDTVLIGHSWGAAVAAQVAATVRCAALVLLCPPPPRPAIPTASRRWTPAARQAVVSSRDGEPGSAYARYLRGYAVPLGLGEDNARARLLLDGVPHFEEAWRQLRGDSGGPSPVEAAARTASHGTPVLAVLPADDQLTDRTGVRDLVAAGLAAAITIPGGHYCFLDAPSELRLAIRDFLHTVTVTQTAGPTRRHA
jgi:pimeloyl-ACP methyl ester carboxylesterase